MNRYSNFGQGILHTIEIRARTVRVPIYERVFIHELKSQV